MDGKDDDCERHGWKRLQEYDPAQRCWKYLSALAEGNAVQEDSLPFDDELGEEDYYPSLPFAALFSFFKVMLQIFGVLNHKGFLMQECLLLT